jgi:hypothetical protein
VAMNPNTQNVKSASSANAPITSVALFMSIVWAEFVEPFTPNDQAQARRACGSRRHDERQPALPGAHLLGCIITGPVDSYHGFQCASYDFPDQGLTVPFPKFAGDIIPRFGHPPSM